MWSGIWSVVTTWIGFWIWIWSERHLEWCNKWLVDFNVGKTQLVLLKWSNNSGSIDVRMDGSVIEEKSSFKMLRLTFSCKSDWDSQNISIPKTASKKIGTLIRSMKFVSPEVALYIYISTICHVWNTVVKSGLVLLVATWCTSSKNEYAGLLVLHLLFLLNRRLIVKIWPV